MYMEELNNEGYATLGENILKDRELENTNASYDTLSKCLVDQVKTTVKNKIFSTFYSSGMLHYSVCEQFVNQQLGEYILTKAEQIHGHIYKSGGFIPKDPFHYSVSYGMPVGMVVTQKSKFVMFIELFRFLYEFLYGNLVIRRNYHETFLGKNKEFQDYFQEIKSTKKTLHSESHLINFKMA
mmetsp:Transcript_23297/g.22891  ORF Transcript_23297/g.22891 Transcript_23297/m.22891 type:complete len:182 (+) Transcript_23297:656-1201(+)